jgi:signal transduction histidine kinase
MSGAPLPAHGAPDASRPAAPAPALKLIDHQGYSLSSLVELSRKLWSTHDIHDAAESLLLNLMGQIGTTHAAVWLSTESAQPVLIRCHGMDAAVARALAAACWTEFSDRFRGGGAPIAPAEAQSGFGESTQSLARQAKVALFAPLCADDLPMGLLALGLPIGRDGFTARQIEVLEASLAVAGLAMRSAHLHSLTMESGRQLRRANEALSHLDRMKSEFLQQLNHELRTPLAVSLGCLQCLSESAVPEADRGTLVATATRSTEEMTRLIERVLTFSESSGGSLVVQLVEADLTAFMNEYFDERRPGISAGLRDLVFECEDVPRPSRLDPSRLRQVVDELIDNSVKFSAPGTKIWLRVRDRVESGTGGTQISVADEGVGIPEDRLPELFQSFRQLDGSRTRKFGGLGIGLAMARQLTEAMGGTVSVESGGTPGPVFSIFLPAA